MAKVEDMVELTLGCCGVTVWFPAEFITERKRTGEVFYCPNGHGRSYRETTAQKLQKELDAAKNELQIKTDKLERVKTGKYPFCWKTVKNLSSHIRHSH